jgi:hypothetical protein
MSASVKVRLERLIPTISPRAVEQNERLRDMLAQ